MDQQRSEVRFSVGTKLLVGVVLLLATAVATLNVSSVLLLEEDKRAYTLQAQSTETVLLGKELQYLVEAALDSSRSILSQVDPKNPIGSEVLKAFLENQTAIAGVHLYVIAKADDTPRKTGEILTESTTKRLGAGPVVEIPEAIKVTFYRDISKGGVALANASVVGGTPVLALGVGDLTQTQNSEAHPALVAFIPLDGIGKDIGGARVTAVGREGLVLFDTDTTMIFSHENFVQDPIFEAAAQSDTLNGATEFVGADQERFLGSYFKPGFGMTVLARTPWKTAMAATYAVREKFILIGLMAVGGAILFALFFSRTISAPIQSLYEATKEVAAGNFDLKLKRISSDEIGALTGSFQVMSQKIVGLIEEKMKQVHLEQELQIASTIQQTLIPPPQVLDELVRIESYYKSAAECGGDWWSYFRVGNKICVMIADATGHGMPSALITAAARSCFSVLNKYAQDNPNFSFSPVEMLAVANRVIHEAAHGKIMMTFFVATLDFGLGKIIYSSAGHNPPWLFKKKGEKWTMKSLTAVGQRLGETMDNSAYEQHELDLSQGDILFLYTDGLTEGKNLSGEMFGKKRVKKSVEESVQLGPYESLQRLTTEFMQHNGEKALDDDVTIAILEMYPNGVSAKTYLPGDSPTHGNEHTQAVGLPAPSLSVGGPT